MLAAEGANESVNARCGVACVSVDAEWRDDIAAEKSSAVNSSAVSAAEDDCRGPKSSASEEVIGLAEVDAEMEGESSNSNEEEKDWGKAGAGSDWNEEDAMLGSEADAKVGFGLRTRLGQRCVWIACEICSSGEREAEKESGANVDGAFEWNGRGAEGVRTELTIVLVVLF